MKLIDGFRPFTGLRCIASSRRRCSVAVHSGAPPPPRQQPACSLHQVAAAGRGLVSTLGCGDGRLTGEERNGEEIGKQVRLLR